jgi:predicted nucleic acid-binding protein
LRLILDAGPLIALGDTRDRRRGVAREILAAEREAPVLSPCIAAEIDYQLQRLAGPQGNRRFLEDLAAARFHVPALQPADFQDVEALNRRYRDLSPGLADLSIVVLAARYRSTRILTFDQRHFRLMKPLYGEFFTLLPFDEDIT